MITCIFDSIKTKVNNGLVKNTKKRFHSMMLEKVINAPINLYYDVTPVPRLLSYFNRDLN